MFTSASNTGRATETRTSACAARWKTTSGVRRSISSDDAGLADVEVVERELVRPVGPRLGQVGERPGRQVVDDVDRVALGQQPIDEVLPMKPAPPVTNAFMESSWAGVRSANVVARCDRHILAENREVLDRRTGADHGAGADDRVAAPGRPSPMCAPRHDDAIPDTWAPASTAAFGPITDRTTVADSAITAQRSTATASAVPSPRCDRR